MNGDQKVHSRKLSSEVRELSNSMRNAYKKFVRSGPMKIPRGVAFLLVTMAEESWAVGTGETDEEKSVRIVHKKPSELAALTRTSVRTIGRELEWAEQNGLIKCVRRPRKGTAAQGCWLLTDPSPEQMRNPSDTDQREADRKRLSTQSTTPRDDSDSAVPPLGIGVHAASIARSSPNNPSASLPASSPAVPPFGRRPVPGSSGPRPGLPVSVADADLGDPYGPDLEQQPQDVRASDARSGAPETDEEWMARMKALKQRMRGRGASAVQSAG